jgi:hypothetical protein
VDVCGRMWTYVDVCGRMWTYVALMPHVQCAVIFLSGDSSPSKKMLEISRGLAE